MGIGSNFSAFCILFHQADEVRMSETSLYCKKIKRFHPFPLRAKAYNWSGLKKVSLQNQNIY